MSEQFSPFGTPDPGNVAVAEAPALEEEAAESGSRNKLLLLVGAAVAVVVGVAVYFLLFSGGSNDTASSGPVVVNPAQPKASASPSASASTAAVPPTATISNAKDPFKPLVVAPTAAPSASTAPSAAPSTSTGTSAGLPAAPVTGGPSTFSVVSVDSKAGTAVTMVDGVKFTASVGQTFATYFKLVAVNVSTPCGVFQYGDSSMNLCAKDTVSLS